eukprot:5385377-Amphidinium_carterae.2
MQKSEERPPPPCFSSSADCAFSTRALESLLVVPHRASKLKRCCAQVKLARGFDNCGVCSEPQSAVAPQHDYSSPVSTNMRMIDDTTNLTKPYTSIWCMKDMEGLHAVQSSSLQFEQTLQVLMSCTQSLTLANIGQQ